MLITKFRTLGKFAPTLDEASTINPRSQPPYTKNISMHKLIDMIVDKILVNS